MKFVDLLAEQSYILKAERDQIEEGKITEDEATKFILRGLDFTTQKLIEKNASGGKARVPMDSVGKKNPTDGAMMEMDLNARGIELELQALHAGFVRIEGPDTPPEDYPADGATAKKNDWFIRWIPRRVRTELANFLIEQGQLSEDEAKN